MRNCYPHKYLWIHAQSFQCPTLCDPIDCIPQGSSVHGVLQARILEWVAVPSSRDLPLPISTSASKIFWGWLKPRKNFTWRRVFGVGELGDSTVVEYLDQVMLWLHSLKTAGKAQAPGLHVFPSLRGATPGWIDHCLFSVEGRASHNSVTELMKIQTCCENIDSDHFHLQAASMKVLAGRGTSCLESKPWTNAGN